MRYLLLGFVLFGSSLPGAETNQDIVGTYLFQGDCIATKPSDFFIILKSNGTFRGTYAVCQDILPVKGKYKRTAGTIMFTFIPDRGHQPTFRIDGDRLYPESKENSFDGCDYVCSPNLIYYQKQIRKSRR